MPQQVGIGDEPVEEGIPAKSNRPVGPPPGGGPVGGGAPGGAFGGFAGQRPQVLSGMTGFGTSGIPITLRKRGFRPGVTPGPPGRSDTVPAMLSPGEMVMNTGVTQDPAQLQQLLAMNQQGAAGMGYEAGGMVPEDMGGGRPPSRLLRLLQILLDLDEQDQAEGAEPEGFAYGGVAGGGFSSGIPSANSSAWGRSANTGVALGGMFGRGTGVTPQTMGGFGRAGAQVGAGKMNLMGPRPKAPGNIGDQPQQSGPAFGYQRDAAGNVTNFDPRNPYGGYSANQSPFGGGLLYRGVGAAGEAGVFDPRGNQALIRGMEEGARGDADALVRRQMSQADLSGLDPAQRAVAKQQALRETGRGVQDIMAKTRAGAMMDADAFSRGLYQDLVGADIGYGAAEQSARNQRIAQQNQGRIDNKAGGGYWGQLAGNVAGQAVGGYAGKKKG